MVTLTFKLPGLDSADGRELWFLFTGMPFFYDPTRALSSGLNDTELMGAE